MKFYGYHGVFEEERVNGQRFFVDVEMFLDLKPAGENDDLEQTVSYAEIYNIVKDITENKIFRLIEALADSIAREILSRYDKINEILVRVRKPDAPIGGELDWPEIELKRSRNDA